MRFKGSEVARENENPVLVVTEGCGAVLESGRWGARETETKLTELTKLS